MVEVARELGKLGVTAASWHSGGGIWCVLIERTDTNQAWIWGVANDTWGADYMESTEWELVDSVNLPDCPSDSAPPIVAAAIARYYA
jgi:hypothetical protein